jgi:hypothetical protein
VCEVAAGLVVQGLRRHVGAVGPGDRAGFRVDRDAREVGRVSERLEYSAPRAPGEIDANEPALKALGPDAVPGGVTTVERSRCVSGFSVGSFRCAENITAKWGFLIRTRQSRSPHTPPLRSVGTLDQQPDSRGNVVSDQDRLGEAADLEHPGHVAVNGG